MRLGSYIARETPQGIPWADTEKTVLLLLLGTGHYNLSEAQIIQSCPTLCDPMDYTVHGIL